MPTYSVIVPTYREELNIDPLCRRLFAAIDKKPSMKGQVELIVVDDNSPDNTKGVVEKLQVAGYPIRLHVRTKERGLSSAVMAGFALAEGQFLMCMDADLQHPPETVPSLFEALEKPGIEFVLGTRYGKGVAIDKDWPVHRRVISWGARLLARPLTPLSDPMSGFFALRRGVLQRGLKDVSAIGYKIALELFVKCQVKRYEEVAFSFGARTEGESKLSSKVILHYLKHLKALYFYAYGGFLLLIMFLLVLFVGKSLL